MLLINRVEEVYKRVYSVVVILEGIDGINFNVENIGVCLMTLFTYFK